MAAWGELFNQKSPAGQLLLWQVGGQAIGAILSPVLTEVQQEVWEAAVEASGGEVHLALSPSQLADMVVRGIMAQADASPEAAKTGTSPDDFQHLVDGAGEPPGLEFVLEAWRRGFVGFDDAGVRSPSVERAIRSSRVYDYWAPVIAQMRESPMSTGEAVDAVIRNQIPRALGEAIAYANGLGMPGEGVGQGQDTGPAREAFKILTDSAGRPPSPTELAEFVRRGFLPLGNVDPATTSADPEALTFAQGILEGDTKDKWLPLYARLVEYLPPPRTITALEREGVITPAEADKLYRQSGLSPDLAAAYGKAATAGKAATHKTLAESAVVKLYADHLVSADDATALLVKLGYDPHEAALILALADHTTATKSLTSAVSKIRGLYVGRKIDAAGARKALADLGLAAPEVTANLEMWAVEEQANVKDLTPAQVSEAFKYGVITQAEAVAQLGVLGYTPYDAWVLLSISAKGPLPDKPAQGPGPSPYLT